MILSRRRASTSELWTPQTLAEPSKPRGSPRPQARVGTFFPLTGSPAIGHDDGGTQQLVASLMRLAGRKQEELALIETRIRDLENGKTPDSDPPLKILELAQDPANQYVTFQTPKKRHVVDSVLLNLRPDNVTLCADYRLPFSILAENGNHPPNSG
jgi:hypothetical protein